MSRIVLSTAIVTTTATMMMTNHYTTLHCSLVLYIACFFV